MEKENLDSKFVRAFFGIISWVLTTGWMIYALVERNWLLLIVVVSTIAGTAIHIEINKKSNLPSTDGE